MNKLKLVSFNLCPFVQRSVITLNEKKALYDIEYIDLQNKPDWFLKISPLGKVPVLQTQGAVIFESAIINEYIDETIGERLLPTNPLERAQHRMWVEFGTTLLVDIWQAQSTHDKSHYDSALHNIRKKIIRLDGVVGGPLFFGSQFSLVDAALAPALQRILWTAELDPQFNVYSNNPKVHSWWKTLESRYSVKESLLPDIKDSFTAMIKALGGVLSQK